jgi:hypothetical protein
MTKVVLTGCPHDLAGALRSMRAPAPVTIIAEPTLMASVLDELRQRGHQVTEDARLNHKILLELAPADLRRLRLLAAVDEAAVLAAARRVIHEQLDELIISPRCASCSGCDPEDRDVGPRRRVGGEWVRVDELPARADLD